MSAVVRPIRRAWSRIAMLDTVYCDKALCVEVGRKAYRRSVCSHIQESEQEPCVRCTCFERMLCAKMFW